MPAPRLRSLSLRGFRAYGAAEQTLNVPADLAAIWGPNSKGKTSLAEAFEFLLTGRTTRRELMASTQDEFADALRNAHLSANDDVYIVADVIASDGASHRIKRTLTRDYAKKQNCESRLEIDGAAATYGDLTSLGFTLSQPPLEAPVLAQHTLSYIFSVRPQDRATYFKALLEVTDLDDLRNDIASVASVLEVQETQLLRDLEKCAASIFALRPLANALQAASSMPSVIPGLLAQAAQALIKQVGEEVPATLDERRSAIQEILTKRRNKTFPVSQFGGKPLSGWDPPDAATWQELQTYLDERQKVDKQTRQLVALFSEALKLSDVSDVVRSTDCPLCATPSALTSERVLEIRRLVEAATTFKTAEANARAAIGKLSASANSLSTSIDGFLPRYLKTSVTDRRSAGFTVKRMRELLGNDSEELISPWIAAVRTLLRRARQLRRAAAAAEQFAERQTANDLALLDAAPLKSHFDALDTARSAFAGALEAYKAPTEILTKGLNELLDAKSDTTGWQEFLNVASKPDELRVALIEQQTRLAVQKEFNAALRQIDRAKEQVLEDKFSDYSDLIQSWWDRLRPGEPTFFSAVLPRKGAKRTIDFKAGLSPNPDRSQHKLRDVIAVFSQSQLHCLGLALFLARAEHDGLGLIFLDDPVLSSDEDYRVHFNSTVLTELLERGLQVIVLTQDHATWEELETRYRHLGISIAQLYIETPAEGTVIENTSDALLAKLNRARSLARGGHPHSRKECGIQLRDAGERFCKEMLVSDRRSKGDDAASLSDYDGKTLEWLCPRVEPLLLQDPSHPGKLAVFRSTVNKACHDNTPPGTDEMGHACGEISYIVKTYLGR